MTQCFLYLSFERSQKSFKENWRPQQDRATSRMTNSKWEATDLSHSPGKGIWSFSASGTYLFVYPLEKMAYKQHWGFLQALTTRLLQNESTHSLWSLERWFECHNLRNKRLLIFQLEVTTVWRMWGRNNNNYYPINFLHLSCGLLHIPEKYAIVSKVLLLEGTYTSGKS